MWLNTLSLDEIAYIKDYYVNLETDLKNALRFYNLESPFTPLSVKEKISELDLDVEIDETHKIQTDHIIDVLRWNSDESIHNYVFIAANQRQFLG